MENSANVLLPVGLIRNAMVGVSNKTLLRTFTSQVVHVGKRRDCILFCQKEGTNGFHQNKLCKF